jgi:hypothetical protein
MTTALRPLTLGELLDRTFQLYRNHFLLFIGIAAIAYFPMFLIRIGYYFLTLHSGKSAVFVASAIIGSLLTIVLYLASMAACQAATITAVSTVYFGQPITLGETYSRIMGQIPLVVLTMIGMGIGIAIGIVLLIVPGIILALMWALTIPVVVLEGAALVEALGRSRALTAGHRGRVFLIFLLFTGLTYLFAVIFEAPLFALIAAKGPAAAKAGGVVVFIYAASFLTETLITPLMTIAFSLMYYDERVRKEAYDIQLLMNTPETGQSQSAAGMA